MGKRSTFEGYLRTHGGRPRDVVSVGVVPNVAIVRGLDATADAGSLTGLVLPEGAIVLKVIVEESTTMSGGTSPILDIGVDYIGTTTDDPNGLCDGLDYEASTKTEVTDALAGVLMGQPLVSNARVTYGDDGVGTNNTAGEIDLYITYTFDDDGVINN